MFLVNARGYLLVFTSVFTLQIKKKQKLRLRKATPPVVKLLEITDNRFEIKLYCPTQELVHKTKCYVFSQKKFLNGK